MSSISIFNTFHSGGLFLRVFQTKSGVQVPFSAFSPQTPSTYALPSQLKTKFQAYTKEQLKL